MYLSATVFTLSQ